MQTIGLIHGMSGVSTVDFYRRLNEGVNQALGGHESAELLMASVNFARVDRCVQTENWADLGSYLAAKARALAAAGANFLVIGSNTGHRVADVVAAATALPLLHVVDAVGEAAGRRGFGAVGLLGTLPVMTGGFYQQRLAALQIDVVVPPPDQQDLVHRMVFEELTRGIFLGRSRQELVHIVRALRADGAEAVVLGCTEFTLLVAQQDVPEVPLLDTSELHVAAVVRAALG